MLQCLRSIPARGSFELLRKAIFAMPKIPVTSKRARTVMSSEPLVPDSMKPAQSSRYTLPSTWHRSDLGRHKISFQMMHIQGLLGLNLSGATSPGRFRITPHHIISFLQKRAASAIKSCPLTLKGRSTRASNRPAFNHQEAKQCTSRQVDVSVCLSRFSWHIFQTNHVWRPKILTLFLS